MPAKFELYKDTTSGNYWFILKAKNGEAVAESQVYRNIGDARAGMKAVQRAAESAHIPDSDAVIEVHSADYIHMHYRPKAPHSEAAAAQPHT